MQTTLDKTPFAVRRTDFLLTVRLALPLIIAEIGWMSMGIVDTIMVGRLPDSAVAIGATGLAQSLYHSVAIFGGGLLLGLDTFVAHAFGREDIGDARLSLVNGLFLALVLTPVLMFAVSFWPELMTRFGISVELVGPMRPFLRALAWGTLPLLAYFALRRYLQAVNVAIPIMFALISANIVNAVGDWALIYGHLGFRAMGITGSGWSTCFARIYMAGVLALTLLWVESKRSLPRWADSLKIDTTPDVGIVEAGRAGGNADSARNWSLCRGHRFDREARAGAALRARDCVELRRAHLYGSVGDQFCRRSASGTTTGKKRSRGGAAGGLVGHHDGGRIHDLLRPGIRVCPDLDRPFVFAGSRPSFARARGSSWWQPHSSYSTDCRLWQQARFGVWAIPRLPCSPTSSLIG